MIDPSIITRGAEMAQLQQRQNMDALADLGGNLGQLVLGRRINQMQQLKTPEEQQAFANKSIFSPQLNRQLKADQAAALKAANDQLKFNAELAKTGAETGKLGSEAFKNNAQGQGYGLENAGKVGAATQKALSFAAKSGDKEAAFHGLDLALNTGEITPEAHAQARSVLLSLNDKGKVKEFAMSMLDPKYNFQTVDNAETNAVSVANNVRTTNASMYSTDKAAETAEKNRVSNDAYRQQQLHMQQNKGQVVNGADGKSYIFYPSLNKYEPMLDQNGQHISKATDQKTVNEENKRIQRIEILSPEIRKILQSGATGSKVGAGIDWLGNTVGISTEGAKATAQLKTLSGQLVALMPRMEGPQSNIDVEMYKEMAGNVADPTLPIETRLAALGTIEDLNQKYKQLNKSPSGAPYANAGQQNPSGGAKKAQSFFD